MRVLVVGWVEGRPGLRSSALRPPPGLLPMVLLMPSCCLTLRWAVEKTGGRGLSGVAGVGGARSGWGVCPETQSPQAQGGGRWWDFRVTGWE